MYNSRCFKSLVFYSQYAMHLLFLLLCLLLFPANGNAVEAETVLNNTENTSQTLSLIQFYTLTNTIPQDLIVLQHKTQTLHGLEISNSIHSITQQIEQLDWETIMAASNANVNFLQLSEIESRLAKIKTRIERLNHDIESDIHLLENELKMWGDKEKQLEEFKTLVLNLSNTNLEPPTIDLESMELVVIEAKDLLKVNIITTLESGAQMGKMLTHLYKISSTLSDLTEDVNQAGKEQTTPSIFSDEYSDQFDVQLLNEWWDNIRLFYTHQLGNIKKHTNTVAICLILTVLLAIVIYVTRPRQPSLRWYAFAARPIVTAILFSGTAFIFYQALALDSALSYDWDNLAFIPLILTVAFYPDTFCKKAYQRNQLRLIIVMFSILQLFSIIRGPQTMLYIFVSFASIIGLIYYIQFIVRSRSQQPPQPIPWGIWLGTSFTLIVIICAAAGYDQLAAELFSRSLSIIVFTLLMTLMFLAVTGLLELLFLHFPVEIVRNNTNVLVKNVAPIFILLFSILWFASILVFLWFYPSLIASLEAITTTSFTIGSMRITLWLLTSIVIVGYTTRLFSQGITKILLTNTLPRHKVDKGVQMSITRLVHYTIMFIGFLIILHILGFGLSQVTLLGGALGVGIGFGLKEIVNNFVSGLILLFERPVKVGDIVVIGEEWGEIKELGLRATTVQTFDNAEIVIPNSALITQNVTNWTLASKRVRVKVQVGIAYGSNIEKVLQILLSCGDANPIVLTQPEPRALFLQFGESSLDFELRVWIPDINDKLQVLSELNQDIESEFSMNNIEIPFPQRDLHIRSIDKTCTSSLKNCDEVKS